MSVSTWEISVPDKERLIKAAFEGKCEQQRARALACELTAWWHIKRSSSRTAGTPSSASEPRC